MVGDGRWGEDGDDGRELAFWPAVWAAGELEPDLRHGDGPNGLRDDELPWLTEGTRSPRDNLRFERGVADLSSAVPGE
jgi:hypothetical protein